MVDLRTSYKYEIYNEMKYGHKYKINEIKKTIHNKCFSKFIYQSVNSIHVTNCYFTSSKLKCYFEIQYTLDS